MKGKTLLGIAAAVGVSLAFAAIRDDGGRGRSSMSASERADEFVRINSGGCEDLFPSMCACRVSVLRDSFSGDEAFMRAVDRASGPRSSGSSRVSVDMTQIVEAQFGDESAYVRQVMRCAAQLADTQAGGSSSRSSGSGTSARP